MNWKRYISLTFVLTLVMIAVFSFTPAFAADSGDAQAQLEEEMLEYLNEARLEAGLNPLELAPQLVEIARLKSQDMITNNYFSHTSPTYGTPFAMLESFGVTYRVAGENLAGHYSVSGAYEALMNSSGHRANILNGDFTHVGIGIVEGGPYSMMITQLFVGQPQFAEQGDLAEDYFPPVSQSDNTSDDNLDNTTWVDYLAQLINNERTKAGLAELNVDDDLTEAAQMKAQEMVDKNYLSHNSPTYGDIEAMLDKLNIPFSQVKENIVGSSDIKLGHDALMESAKHKEIILDPNFTYLGLGVQQGGSYGFNIVEVFASREDSDKGEVETPQPTPVSQPETNPTPQPAPEDKYQAKQLEQEMVGLINQERVKSGLAPLSLNEELTEIARQKAQDMVDNNYLSYTSTYGGTKEFLKAADIQYSSFAESIVAASAVAPAHKALMGVDKHKSNILDSSFQEIGVGMVESPQYGYIMVEIFLDKRDSASLPQDETKPQVDPSPAPGNSQELSEQEEMEYQMLSLINEARQEAGVAPLKMDEDVVKVARLKSQDMIDNNYFAHWSPTYGSPFTMMDSFGINYRYGGENLAGHYSVEGAFQALMDSSGHRRNILDPNFTHVGIGIVQGGPYKIMFTQMFIGY